MGVAERTLIAVAMSDLAAADAAFERLVHGGLGPGATRDVVTIGRSRSGVVRFDRETPVGGPGPTCSIAAGVAAALYPSVGADLPGVRALERTVLSAVAGRIALAVGRKGMLELGEHLDSASAALIACVPAGIRAQVLDAVGDDGVVLTCSLVLDVDDIWRSAGAARRSARPPPGGR